MTSYSCFTSSILSFLSSTYTAIAGISKSSSSEELAGFFSSSCLTSSTSDSSEGVVIFSGILMNSGVSSEGFLLGLSSPSDSLSDSKGLYLNRDYIIYKLDQTYWSKGPSLATKFEQVVQAVENKDGKVKQNPNGNVLNEESCIPKELVICDPGIVVVRDHHAYKELWELINAEESIESHKFEG